MKGALLVKATFLVTLVLGAGFNNARGQVDQNQLAGGDINTITTAVPFLLIAPDARAAGMADVGVATSADGNSIHWNVAKLAFVEKDFGISVSYVPWLKQLVPDINLAYLSGYKQIGKKRHMQTVGGSLRYFSLGNIQFTNEFGENTTQFRPNEFAFDLAYARKLSKRVSGGIAARYIHSDLTGNAVVGGANTKPGQTFAVDLGFYYINDDMKMFDRKLTTSVGLAITNLGAKIKYSDLSKDDFLPLNLRLGLNLKMDFDEFNSLSLSWDINKLMVPTPPIYADGATSGSAPVAGIDPDEMAVVTAMFSSFGDAPGNPIRDDNGDLVYNSDGKTVQVEEGSQFAEELREYNLSWGLEYWYNKMFAIRAGFFYEDATKGNRKFFTLGAGVRYNVFGLDFAYLIPTNIGAGAGSRSPLENTLRFTLTFDFDGFRKSRKSKDDVAD